jgi:hypothetical protein
LRKVEDHFLVHVAIDEDRLRERRAVHDELHAGLLDGGAKDARELPRQVCEIRRHVPRLDSPGLDPRKIQQRVDELLQAERVPVYEHEARALICVLRARDGILHRSEEQREWSSELVADVAEERGLRRSISARASARFFSSSYARAFAIAVETCDAMRS